MRQNIAEVDQPVSRDGYREDNPMRAAATTLQFPDLGITVEQGDLIATDNDDRCAVVFDKALMNERGMWTVVYEDGPGGHGYGWLKMKLRRGEYKIVDKANGGVQ